MLKQACDLIFQGLVGFGAIFLLSCLVFLVWALFSRRG